jgi:hypothetical protein
MLRIVIPYISTLKQLWVRSTTHDRACQVKNDVKMGMSFMLEKVLKPLLVIIIEIRRVIVGYF